jgi:hypothetical protein
MRAKQGDSSAIQAERDTAAEAILENRRRRLGANHEPLVCPPDWFAGCRSTADRSLRTRQLHLEERANGVGRSDEEPSQNTFR